ncbi:MAG: hypothetical protein ACRDOL_44540, partial [Streptosporangiaceae bacterium]
LAAYVPTFANGWRGEETWPPFAQFTAAAALTLAVADFAVPAGVIYPAYESAVNAAMTVIVLASPRRQAGLVRPGRHSARHAADSWHWPRRRAVAHPGRSVR